MKTLCYNIVEGDYYEFGENTLTKSGVYTETFATWGTACDSVVNLTLEVLTGVDNIYTLPKLYKIKEKIKSNIFKQLM